MRYDAPMLRNRASGRTANETEYGGRRLDSRMDPGQELASPVHHQRAAPGDARRGPRLNVHPLVLVVDDEASLRNLLAELLEDAGYSVLTARNGMEALSLVQHEHPAVVLTDFTMPVLDGPGLIQRLRTSPATRHIPIIAMSATRPPATARCDVPFIEKPFDVEEVLEAVASQTAGLYGANGFLRSERSSSATDR